MAREFDVRLGARLRGLRQASGWSQERLGREIGTTQDAISLYERGERSMGLNTLVAAAKVLDVPLSALLETHPDVVVVRGSSLHALLQEVQESPEDLLALRDMLAFLRWRRQERTKAGRARRTGTEPAI